MKNNSAFRILFLVFIFLAIILAGFFIYLTYNSSSKNNRFISTPSPTPSPLPSPKPIPHGKIGFSVGQADKSIPQLGRGSIDPYDPPMGGKQTVTIAVKHSQPVTRVTAVLKTDNSVSQPVPLQLISGTNTDGQWQGSWQVNDTYLYIYNLVLKAESSDKQAAVEITLR